MATPEFTNLPDLCASNNGGKVLFATDDWFAVAENLLQWEDPVWKEGVYTPCGKWMDGWETRRKRSAGHDWCIIKLAYPGVINGVDIDTAFFTGNFVPQFSIQAAYLDEKDEELMKMPARVSELGNAASEAEMKQIECLHSEKWQELIPMEKLRAGYPDTRHNYFRVQDTAKWTHLRLNAFPDGGIARLHVYGIVAPDWDLISNKTINLLGMENGAQCVAFSNAHYGHPRNIMQPHAGLGMSDGWETSRQTNRPPILKYIDDESKSLNFIGNEWAIYKFGCSGAIKYIEVDTSYFIGNSPMTVEISGSNSATFSTAQWSTVLSPQKIIPNTTQKFENDLIQTKGPLNFVKITIVPDGGVSRIKIFGSKFDV